MGRPHICPWCEASGPSTIKKGFRKTKTMGNRGIRLCKACGRKFTPKNQKVVMEEEYGASAPETVSEIAADSCETNTMPE